jgi:hypothetical protein
MSIYAKLYSVQEEMEIVVANRSGGHGKYADLKTLLARLKPLLESQKLLLIQELAGEAGTMTVITKVIDSEKPEDHITHSVSWDVQKMTLQQAGSCRTYLARYALLTMFVVPIADDDAAAASFANQMQATTDKIGNSETSGKLAELMLNDQTEAYAFWASLDNEQKRQAWPSVNEATKAFMKSKEWKALGVENGTA